MPTSRRTVWNPGIPGGIPARSTVCAVVNASTYGNGTMEASAGIQSAINGCPAGQVVQLSAGNFLVNANPITIGKGVTLRGMGPNATQLRKTNTSGNPVVIVGERWPSTAGTTNLTANAPKGATSVVVASTTGLTVGRLVMIDELTDPAYVYWGPNCEAGDACRGWFSRTNRPVGQMLEIAAINGNTVTFTTPLHIGFQTARTAQLVRFANAGVRNAGLEDLYVRGGREDNVIMTFTLYSWVKNVESYWSIGDSIAVEFCLRCVVRDSYVHETPDPNPGGAGYMLSLAWHTSDTLIENNIFMKGNKVMVMRATGGGNVVGYNYFDDGYIGYDHEWVETGMNASHMTCPHFELFEGNQAFNIDGDNSWGGAFSVTYFRNHASTKRRSYPDLGNRRAIGLMWGHYDYSFVGNVLGTFDMDPSPYSGFVYETTHPWDNDPIGMWKLGYNPENWNAPADARVVSTTHRHGNWDYATNSIDWKAGFDTTLPNSLYLTSRAVVLRHPPLAVGDPQRLHQALHAARPRPLRRREPEQHADDDGGEARRGQRHGDLGPERHRLRRHLHRDLPGRHVRHLDRRGGGRVHLRGLDRRVHRHRDLPGHHGRRPSSSARRSTRASCTRCAVVRAGNGTGTVTSSPAGINCGATCNASFLQGTVGHPHRHAGRGLAVRGLERRLHGHGLLPVHDELGALGDRDLQPDPEHADPHRHPPGPRRRQRDVVPRGHQLRRHVLRGVRHGHHRHPHRHGGGRLAVRRMARGLLGRGRLPGDGQRGHARLGHVPPGDHAGAPRDGRHHRQRRRAGDPPAEGQPVVVPGPRTADRPGPLPLSTGRRGRWWRSAAARTGTATRTSLPRAPAPRPPRTSPG